MNDPQNGADPFGWFAQLALGHQHFGSMPYEVIVADDGEDPSVDERLQQRTDAMFDDGLVAEVTGPDGTLLVGIRSTPVPLSPGIQHLPAAGMTVSMTEPPSHRVTPRPMATTRALATVLPSTTVASNSEGCLSNRATMEPRAGFRSASCSSCHLLKVNNADSASAKKKLAAAKSTTPSTTI